MIFIILRVYDYNIISVSFINSYYLLAYYAFKKNERDYILLWKI